MMVISPASAARAVTTSRRRTAAAIGIGVGAVYAGTATWVSPVSIDVYVTALEAWRWSSVGAPWLEDLNLVWQAADGAGAPPGILVETAHGHLVTSRTPGVVLAAVPAYALAGLDSLALWPSTIVAVVLATAAVVMVFLALDGLVARPLAVVGALGLAFATPTWSVSADALWTHSLTQAGIAGAMLAASRARWWLTGTALGLAMLGRVHVALIAASVGLLSAWSSRDVRPAVKVGVPAAAGLAAVVVINQYRYGVASLSGGYGYVDENLAAADANALVSYLENVAGFLVSPDRGLLLWAPVLFLLLPAALRAARTAPVWVTGFAVGGLAYSALQLKINFFSGGEAFYGYRLPLELVTCLVPLYVLAWAQVRHDLVKVVAIVLLYLQTAIIAVGAIVPGLWWGGDLVWRGSSLIVAGQEAPLVLGVSLAVALVLAVATVRWLENQNLISSERLP